MNTHSNDEFYSPTADPSSAGPQGGVAVAEPVSRSESPAFPAEAPPARMPPPLPDRPDRADPVLPTDLPARSAPATSATPPRPAEKRPAVRRLDALRPILLRANHKFGKMKLPHWVVYQHGRNPDAVVEKMVAALRRDAGGSIEIGWAAEKDHRPGLSRPLRVVSALHPLHRVGVDMVFYAQGSDLYVRFELIPRTWLTYLRFVMYGVCFLTLFGAAYAMFFNHTESFQAVATEYAKKYGGADSALEVEKMTNSAFGEPRTMGWFFHKDPKLFLTTLGGPPTIIAGAIGMLLFAIPKDLIRHPCRLLGWPAPDAFKNHATLFAARLDRIFSRMLGDEFNVFEPDGARRIEAD